MKRNTYKFICSIPIFGPLYSVITNPRLNDSVIEKNPILKTRLSKFIAENPDTAITESVIKELMK